MKKIISIILLISMLCGFGVNVSAYSGAGTESNPYVITTPEDLMNIKNDLSAHYVLGNSIDMSGVWYEPIGNDIDGAFTGSFDGKGYTISNLDLDLEGFKYVGLFGCLDGAVKNVNLTNIVASGYKYVGGISGYADYNSFIYNCDVDGKFVGKYITGNIYVGNIAGCNFGTISNCSNSGSVLSSSSDTSSYAGGIAGYNSEGTISNCSNSGSVSPSSSHSYAGGIAGYNSEGTISNCSNSGSVSASATFSYAGGIAGYNSEGTISNCSNSGSVSSSSSTSNVYAGGIAGRNNSGTISNCSNSGSVSSSSSYAGGIAGRNEGTISNCTNNGNVSSTSSSSSSSYAGGIAGYNSESKGIITDCINNGNVSNGYSGGIAGRNYGTITSCVNNGNITTSPYIYTAGGIAGDNTGIIANCINSGIVVAANISTENYSYAGGIAGYNAGEITECANKTTVMATSNYYSPYSGGIAGYNAGLKGTITDCINGGNVKSYYSDGRKTNTISYAGGITGYNRGTLLSRCINIGNVVSTNNLDIAKSRAGGIVGLMESGNITFCYSLIIKSREYALGTELTIVEFRDKSNFEGLDFIDKWIIKQGINGGFPQLRDLPEHIHLNKCVEIMAINDVDTLKAYIGEKSEPVVWSSDDSAIATVSSNGVITATSIGTATITATNSKGMKANCLIYIYSKADSISLNKTSTSIAAGSSETLTCTQNPSTANEVLIWSSNDDSIASVDQQGKITANKKGTTVITATAVNSGISKSCTVTVTGNPITSISLSSSITMNVDESKRLTPSISPSQYEGNLTWKSSNLDIASVDNDGNITAKAPGTTVISVTSDTVKTAQCTVTVKAPVTEINFAKPEITIVKGYTEKLVPIINPTNTTDTLSWSSSSTSYASVSADGTVTANRVGTATITATTTSGKKAYCTVNVVNPSVSVSSVTLDKTELIMTKADMAQLKASILPTNATNQNLTWVSSDESVATVNSTGVVTAVDTGVAIISATANNGVYHECVIKVISASSSSVVLSDAKASPDGTVQVKASLVKNPGISGYKFIVNYDESILTPVRVSNNSDFGGSITTNLEDSNRKGLNIVWYANEDVTVNGELFTIDFKVSDNAKYGDTSSVSIEYGAKDICNTAGEYFALYIDDATISIEEPIPGDIYEDGEVTIYDLNLLSRYITSLETFTERQKEAADVNNDGLIDILDVIRLAQYLAGWSDVELMSVGLFSLREPAAPVISVGSASVNAANEAEIPVYIKGNTGIAAYRFVLDYNADDIEILSITPSDLIDKDAFNTNLGAESQAEDGLIVTSRTSGGNMTEDGALFTIKVRYKNPVDTSVSPISIIDNFNNIGNENATYVTATYETGYALGNDYILANKVVGDTNFSCELYFDDSYAEQAAYAIIAFYDGDGRMVQLMPSDITVKPGKVDLSIDYDKKAYASYKLMIWKGMCNLKPITKMK